MLGIYLLLAFIFAIILALALSTVLTHKRLRKVTSSPLEFSLAFEEIQLKTIDNLRLNGWWIPAGNSPFTIIFLHGFNGSMDPDLKYAPHFHQSGYNILMFDFRAHSRSKGNATSLGAIEVSDAEAAIKYTHDRGSKSIGLLGFSMGGRVALLTAAEIPGISAVVSDGGPVRLSTAINEELKQKSIPCGFRQLLTWMIVVGASLRVKRNLFSQDPIKVGPKLKNIPILFIHAEKDPYTNIQDLQNLRTTIGDKAEIWTIQGVGHRETDVPDLENYLERITAFFDAYMKL